MHFLSAYLSMTNNYSKQFQSCRSVNYGEDDDSKGALDGSNSSASSDINASVEDKELRNKIEKRMISLARSICLNTSFKGILASKIAASIIMVAREINGVRRNASRSQMILGYKTHELISTMTQIKEELMKNSSGVSVHADDISCLSDMLKELSMEAEEEIKIHAPSPSVEPHMRKDSAVNSSPCSIANGSPGK